MPCLAAPAPAKGRRKAVPITLEQLVQELQAQGEVTQLPAVLAKLTGFPEGSLEKGVEVLASETTDSLGRRVGVVFSNAGSADATSPAGLFWSTALRVDRRSEAYDYNTALDGTLKKAVRVDGQRDENGRPVRGAGKATELDLQSPEVRDRFRSDVLDFWLKGKGRKKAGSKAASGKRPTGP